MTKRAVIDIFDDLADLGCLAAYAGHDLEQWAVDGVDPHAAAYEHKLIADEDGRVTFPAGTLTTACVTVRIYDTVTA